MIESLLDLGGVAGANEGLGWCVCADIAVDEPAPPPSPMIARDTGSLGWCVCADIVADVVLPTEK